MTERKIFGVFLVVTLSVAACSVFGTPHAGPCGICEPVTIAGQKYELCGKPAELAQDAAGRFGVLRYEAHGIRSVDARRRRSNSANSVESV